MKWHDLPDADPIRDDYRVNFHVHHAGKVWGTFIVSDCFNVSTIARLVMARFYGIVQGNRGQATRLGHPNSGLYVKAASYSGAVVVDMYDCDGVDCVRISLAPHLGHGVSGVVYDGPIKNAGALLPLPKA